MKESSRVLVALVAAVAGGIAIALSGSSTLLRAADAVAPVGALWVNAIRMTVIPLVVALIVTGVASVADVKTIGRLGARTLGVFVVMLGSLAIVAVPLTAVLLRPVLRRACLGEALALAAGPSTRGAAWPPPGGSSHLDLRDRVRRRRVARFHAPHVRPLRRGVSPRPHRVP